MKKLLLYFVLSCLLFILVIPKLHISMVNENSGKRVINSIYLPDDSIEMLNYLANEHLNNVEVLVFNDTFLLNKANSTFIAGIMNNGYKIGIVMDLSSRDDDYIKKLSNVLADKSIRILYFQNKNSKFDHDTFMKISGLSKEHGFIIGLLENEQQNGLQYSEVKEYSTVVEGISNRALYTDNKVINGLSNTEVSLRLLRSVVDRSIRLNLLGADNLETLKRYNTIIKELNGELLEKGYKVSWEALPVTAPSESFYNFFIVLAFTAVAMFSFQEAFGLKRKILLSVFAVFLIVTLNLYFLDYRVAMLFLVLVITILVPAFVTIRLYNYLSGNFFTGSFIGILKLNGSVFLIYMTTGLFIWFALSSFIFRIGFMTYKLAIISYISPIIIILIYILHRDGYDLYQLKKALCKRKSIAIMLLSAAIVTVYLSRSGNFSLLPATPAELYFRMLLEKIMPARPRFKEFLIGYPAFFLLFAVRSRKNKTVFNYLLLMSAIAGISVLNTFCHSYTAVNVSLIRALSGFILGNITGAAAYFLFKTYFSDRTW